jgi:NTP pyrophosphatase (non-canonical NTP hydrolase)
MNLDKFILQKALNTWGVYAQLGIAQEECAELIQAISKYFRGDDPLMEHVEQEIADVIIIIEQLLLLVNSENVQNHINNKMERINKRMDRYHEINQR